MNRAVTIQHDLAEVTLKPTGKVNTSRLKEMIRSTLDHYLEEDRISSTQIHNFIRERHGDNYLSAGYYLRLYRLRAGLTQSELAGHVGVRQHHLSEMENNKRVLGKALARKIAQELNCEYQKLL